MARVEQRVSLFRKRRQRKGGLQKDMTKTPGCATESQHFRGSDAVGRAAILRRYFYVRLTMVA
jgi:hypothetical protein